MPRTDTPDHFDWVALTRFFAGELTLDEQRELRRWIEADPERHALVEELRGVWQRAAALRQHWDAEAALRRIKSDRDRHRPRLLSFPGLAEAAAGGQRRLAGWRRVAGVAAALALLAGTGVTFRQFTRSPAAPTSAATSEVVTRRAERATVRLSDGTRISLAPASRLRYSQSYGADAREVFLEGQAFFDVTHDSTMPFVVRTARAVATDLGTRFTVRAYLGERATEVVVTDGAVLLGRAAQSAPARLPNGLTSSVGVRTADTLLLRAGELGTLPDDSAAHRRRVDDTAPYVAWTEGRLVFRDTPLADAMPALARWYDTDLRLADSTLGRRRLTASFREEPVAEVVRLVATALELRTRREGSAVIFLDAAPDAPDRRRASAPQASPPP